MIYDLRFGSSLGWVREIMNHRPNADIPFKYLAEVDCVRQAAERGRGDVRGPPPAAERLRFLTVGKIRSARAPAPRTRACRSGWWAVLTPALRGTPHGVCRPITWRF